MKPQVNPKGFIPTKSGLPAHPAGNREQRRMFYRAADSKVFSVRKKVNEILDRKNNKPFKETK